MLAFAWAATPAFATRLGPEQPHSPNAETIETTYWVMIAIVAALIVLVNIGLVAAAVRFRERRGREPSRFAAGRGALRPALAALALLAVAVFVFGLVQTSDVRELAPSGPNGLSGAQTAQVGVSDIPADETAPLEINAIAQQWLWRFEYPGGQPGQRTFTYGELVVPVDTTVLLNVTAIDVIHSWWVPALGGQVQAVPGDVSQTWFRADEVGRYPGSSTIFSGTSFPAMRSWVRVVTAPEYQQYVEQLKRDLSEAQGIVAEAQQRGQGSE